MRYRGLMTVCVLTFGLVLAVSASGMAQETKPAPAEPALVPVPADRAPGTVQGSGQTDAAGADGKKGDPNSTGGGKTQQPQQGPDTILFVVLIGGVVLMWIWMGRGRRKQETKHKEMLANLKKGDKIVTIGGIIGTVIEVRPDEVTVKVDETNNVRMKFTRRAIAAVGEDARTTNPDDDKK